jgi:hypothetical protein
VAFANHLLAEPAQISVAMLIARGNSVACGQRRAANDLAVRQALESAGVEFIDENGGGPGVRLSERIHKKRDK